MKRSAAILHGFRLNKNARGNCDARALEIAEEIAALPPLTVMQIKDAVLSGADIPLSSALQIERKAHELMYGTQDMREGTNAFAEKRKSEFKGL